MSAQPYCRIVALWHCGIVGMLQYSLKLFARIPRLSDNNRMRILLGYRIPNPRIKDAMVNPRNNLAAKRRQLHHNSEMSAIEATTPSDQSSDLTLASDHHF